MLDTCRPVEEGSTVELTLPAGMRRRPSTHQKDRAVDEELLPAVHVGGILSRDRCCQRHLQLTGRSGEQYVGVFGKSQILGLVLVEYIGQDTATRIGGEAVMVIAADTGKERREIGSLAGGICCKLPCDIRPVRHRCETG